MPLRLSERQNEDDIEDAKEKVNLSWETACL